MSIPPVVIEEIKKIAADEPLPKILEKSWTAKEEALSIEYYMIYIPELPLRDICNQGRIYSKYKSHQLTESLGKLIYMHDRHIPLQGKLYLEFNCLS